MVKLKLHKKLVVGMSALLCGALAASVYQHFNGPVAKPDKAVGPVPWPVRKLAVHLSSGGTIDGPVSVSFQHRPDPTDDPLVWVWREAANAPKLPPDYRLVFSTPPDFSGKPPYVVVGYSAFVVDGQRRINGLHGLAVIGMAIAR